MPSDQDSPVEKPAGARGDPSLPPRNELIKICMQMMQLREAGNFKELADFLTDDCEMLIPGVPGMNPFVSAVKGRDECLKVIRSNFTLIELVNLVPINFVQDGDCMVVTWSSGARNRGTGPLLEVHGLSRLRFRGRKICLYTNYFDTAAVAALAEFPRRDL